MKTFFRFFVFLFVTGLSSCSKMNFGFKSSESDEVKVEHEMIVLGDQLQDPYSLSNMTKAFAALYPTKAGVVELSATDHYVRLLPRNKEDLDNLEKMGVKMIDHPMDYKIVREGDYYHDPEIAEGSITWQYAVVPPDFKSPIGIKCELLHECYLAEPENVTKAGLDWVDWDAVERASFQMTGNEDMLNETTKAAAVYPEGRITIVDKEYSKDPIGVSGVLVSCNVFVKVAQTYTDKDGYYKMPKKFSAKPRYRIVYTNKKGFTQGINALFVKTSMSTLGKHDPSGYSINVTENSERKLFVRCAINNAVYDYYENCSAYGIKIKTPPANLTIWSCSLLNCSATLMMHQGALLSADLLTSFLGPYIPIVALFSPDIFLGSQNFNTYSGIYRTVSHELAHASHYMQVKNEYWNKYALHILESYVKYGGLLYGTGVEDFAGYCEVGEMWAYYVETMLYRERYGQTSEVFGSDYWFHPEIFIYLDNRGINRYRIFPTLSSDVHSRDVLRSRLLSLYPECKSMINEAFNKYL